MTTSGEENVFLDYLATLPAEKLSYLHGRPSAALFIFRLLPNVAQQVVVKLIWNSNVTDLLRIERADIKINDCISLLESLHIVRKRDSHDYVINNNFRRSYLNAVMLGAHRCSGLRAAESEEKKKTKDIAKKSSERWECILRYLALPSDQNMSTVSPETRQLFRSAGFTSGDDGDIEITSSGFQFLLLSPVLQMWTYVREYLRMEAAKGNDVLELIDLLIRVILCVDKSDDPSKSCYQLDASWTARENELISHLRELGLIFIRKRKDGIFFLTPLLWNLTVGREPETVEDRKSGNIIVETNYRLYAYTNSSLLLAILSTFTEMTYRFNDMCVGILTRESVRRALQVGITAAQIISFLRTNAHPQCLSSRGPINCLPVTVADQIRLWEDERKRLNMVDAALYTGFESEREYSSVRDFAASEGILQYADNNQQLVIVTSEGHELVKQWWKEHRNQTGPTM